ncbi:MarR family winged helix-turn-helix transcriptional regulator [Mycolicibacter senuensis]|uniref:MarR family transcriptional regulator n=1 Tax=Mycolicibacter senuensis TaxID=386913 RepID=A0A7I9XLF6_9MYCO|nr:helix-turn-helix domain-containing protein [Mycolicibacter senuensis]MDQ2625913.1 MarR family transcriptional regulator [Actinomycetota bacterium]ORW63672.1 MarR family transcriptional regulator [Mycolicibacter senuensis]GFG70400.1 MarR family transcriptional regulator [Mycolicibacter senuensis]
MALPDDVYTRLLTFRTRLRRFERWSADQAQAAGLTPAQHQLLLAIRGHADSRGPTVGDVAEYLLLRHHSAGELIQRAEAAGLVIRVRDNDDQRMIRLQLTEAAAQCLQALTELHLEELERFSAESPLAP